MKSKIELNPKSLAVIRGFLEGETSSRTAAEELGVSHQGFINFITALVREWFQKGIIKFDIPGYDERLQRRDDSNNGAN